LPNIKRLNRRQEKPSCPSAITSATNLVFEVTNENRHIWPRFHTRQAGSRESTCPAPRIRCETGLDDLPRVHRPGNWRNVRPRTISSHVCRRGPPQVRFAAVLVLGSAVTRRRARNPPAFESAYRLRRGLQ